MFDQQNILGIKIKVIFASIFDIKLCCIHCCHKEMNDEWKCFLPCYHLHDFGICILKNFKFYVFYSVLNFTRAV